MRRPPEALFSVGRVFSPFYALVMRLRAVLYRKGLLASTSLPVQVISIGNLTMGGTGKTPMVLAVVQRLVAMGKRPAIVSRGYGSKGGGAVRVVADGSKLLLSAVQAGDEPCMLANALPGVPVLVGPKRAEVAREAVCRFGVDAIVMDDGFQHLALQRDLDLVLFSARNLLGNGWVFPGGDLREPWSALRRAHAFVITGMDSDNHDAVDELVVRLGQDFPGRPVFLGGYRPTAAVCAGGDGRVVALKELQGISFFAFAGIAQPESFRATLESSGLRLVGFRGFGDHHHYGQREMAELVEEARRSGASGLIATEKDLVKLGTYQGDLPLWGLRIELQFGEDFDRFLKEKLGG